MAELNYLNPASLLPDTREMAGGEYASPFSRAFQATIAANRAVPFLQQAMQSGDLAYKQALSQYQESQSPLAQQFKDQQMKSGINQLLMNDQAAKIKKANMEALDFYPTATKALQLYQKGDEEGAKNLYDTYVQGKDPSEIPNQLKTFGQDALRTMIFTKNKIESDPELVQKIAATTAVQAPELASKERINKYHVDETTKSAEKVAQIHAQATMAGIQAQLDKTEAGQFSRVVEKLNNGQNLDAGDRLLLSNKVTDEFAKSPGGKLLTQMSSLLLISGIKDTNKATELLTQLTKDTWTGFIKNLPESAQKYLKDEIPDVKSLPQETAPTTSSAPTTGTRDLGPATGYAEGVTGKKGGIPVIVRNGRFVPINE